MDKLADFAGDMQKFLLKMENENGELKFVSSCATQSTSHMISELVDTVFGILEKYNIPKEFSEDKQEENKGSKSTIPIVAQCYNYLLLNTNFSSQKLLTEDFLCGHMVDVWPALSPYLFIRIIWALKYDKILVESLQHIPLDLCVDILEITIKCINELNAERAISLIFSLMKRIYCKCLSLHMGIISAEDVTKCTNQLVESFEMLLDLLGKFSKFPDIDEQKKHEQHGMLLKRILRHIKLYMCENKRACTIDPDIDSSTSPYKLTYGDPESYPMYQHTLSLDEVKSIVTTMDQRLITLLLNQIKQVDCFEYMGWAEVYDTENNTITLQRAVIIECYYFIKSMKEDDFLAENDHLNQCLQQLMGSNSSENLKKFVFTLQELCYAIANGKPENKKELLKRYKEWDQSVLSFLYENPHLLEKDDSFVLLEYLHEIFGNSLHSKEEKHQAYGSILKIMLKLNAENMRFIILKYTIRYFDNNRFKHLYNQKHFEAFLSRNTGCMQEPVAIRTLLIFTLLDPKEVLTTLVKVVIGYIEYKDIIFRPRDMLLLRPFLCIQEYKSNSICSLLITTLRKVVKKNYWNSKNFVEFITLMLENQMLNPDCLMNKIYIPYLNRENIKNRNYLSILILVYDMLAEKRCTHQIDYTFLIYSLTGILSRIRKCDPHIKRSIVKSVVTNMLRIISFPFHAWNLLTVDNRCNIRRCINNYLDPIDRVQLWHNAPYMPELIREYEKRCLIAHRQLLRDLNSKIAREYAQSILLNQDIFIMHMMLHATEEEFQRFALELTTMFWFMFGWANELEAYKKVLCITAKAAHLALMRDDTFPSDSFVVLLRALVSFCAAFANIKDIHIRENQTIICYLQKTLFSLTDAVMQTRYRRKYCHLLVRVKDISTDESYLDAENCFHEISESIEMYLAPYETLLSSEEEILSTPEKDIIESCKEDSSLCDLSNDDITDLWKAYKFVCACIERISTMETHRCIELIREIFGQ